MSKVTGNFLVGKTKKKEPNELQNRRGKMLLNKTIHKFLNLTLCSHMLGNITEIFQNIYHVD